MKIQAWFLAMVCVLAPVCYAQGNIQSLTVQNGIATFTLLENHHGSPVATCASAEHQLTWTVALNSAKGQATYVMLMSSVAANLPVKVTSANDCADINGISRATSVSMQPRS